MARSRKNLKTIEVVSENVVSLNPLTEVDIENLKIIGIAADEGCYVNEQILVSLVAHNLVEVNRLFRNKEGDIATRINGLGVEFLKTLEASKLVESIAPVEVPVPTLEPVNDGIKIDDNVPVPTSRKEAKRRTQYPIKYLQPGQSFFVPVSAKNKAPKKTLSSAASIHRRRLRDSGIDENQLPKFIIRTVSENDNKGARIWRTK